MNNKMISLIMLATTAYNALISQDAISYACACASLIFLICSITVSEVKKENSEGREGVGKAGAGREKIETT